MIFTIVTVGKPKKGFILEGLREFQKRIDRYAQLTFLSVKEEKIRDGVQENLILEREGERLLEKLPRDGFCLALDRKGREMSSEEHFALLDDRFGRGIKKIFYLIGGPLGLSPRVLTRADMVLSLSRMTLPHEMAALFLIEQIYRYLNHKAGEKYHK